MTVKLDLPSDVENLACEPERDLVQSVFALGVGLFGSPEDTALLDEVVAIAYEERRRPFDEV